MTMQLVRGNSLLLADLERIFERAKAGDFDARRSPNANPHGDLISALTGIMRRAKGRQYDDLAPAEATTEAEA